MERIKEVTLYEETTERDEIGQIRKELIPRLVLGVQNGITRQEWAMAGQQGLKPQLMIFFRYDGDYRGEQTAMIDGQRYTIYRTYETNDGGVELYMQKEVGS